MAPATFQSHRLLTAPETMSLDRAAGWYPGAEEARDH